MKANHESDLEKAKQQIRALLNLGNDDGATEAEAENALRFARRLMLRHNLTEDEISSPKDPHEIAAETEYATADHWTEGLNLTNWETWLAGAIDSLVGTVKHYSTSGPKRNKSGTLLFDRYGRPKNGAVLVFYGPAEDVEIARQLQEEWSMIISAMARLRYGGALRGPGRAYAEGFVTSLVRKAEEMQRAERKQIADHKAGILPPHEASQALVLVQATSVMAAKIQKGAEWLKKVKGVHLRPRRASYGYNYDDARAHGEHDGQAADFKVTRYKKLPPG